MIAAIRRGEEKGVQNTRKVLFQLFLDISGCVDSELVEDAHMNCDFQLLRDSQ